jgi:GT2 family glycosyltransferase
MSADTAVVVGNYQGEQVLADCLESLKTQSRTISEVIVVDGGSSDGSHAVAARFGARFIVEPNLGLGHLYNVGAHTTACDYVLLCNNDVAFEPECIERLSAALDEDERRFAADPTQLAWDGGRVIHARTLVRRGRLLHEYIPGLHIEHDVPAAEVVPTVSAHGAAMLVRRQRLVELGGFDESFFMEWEDLDLCWRAWAQGWPSVYVPQARLRHRVGAVTTGAAIERRLASSHHNLLRFALTCLPRADAARAVAGSLLRFPRHPRAIVRALGRVATEAPEIARRRRQVPRKRELREVLMSFV